MFFIRTLFETYVACLAVLALLYCLDCLWYRAHPGANEEFARIDAELSAQGM